MPIDQQSMFSQLAATGMFSGGTPPNALLGGRILGIFPGDVNFGQQLSPQAVSFIDKPLFGGAGIAGIFANGGGYGRRPGAPGMIEAFVKSVQQDLAKMNNEGNAALSQSMAAAHSMLAAGVSVSSGSGNGLGGVGRSSGVAIDL